MEANPHTYIAALRHSQDRLDSLVQPLRPEALRGPSYHAWTIAEVLSHVGSQADLFAGWLTAALEGTEPPGRDSMQQVWDAWNARGPEEQARDSLTEGERLVRRFEGFSPEQLERMCLSLFGMDLDAAGLARMRLADHALHTWDVAVALDPAARVAPDAVAALIDTLGPLAARAGKPHGKAFRLHLRTNAPDRAFALTVGDTVELTPWSDGQTDGELRMPAEAFPRLVYGRLDPAHTPPVELTGEYTMGDLRQTFPGV